MSAAPSASAAAAEPKKMPETEAEADAQRAKGVAYTNVEIREHYLKLISQIQPTVDQMKKDGKKAEERAKKAYQLRHDARMLCRAMMTDRKQVEELKARDKEKYGQGDGPTFEQLFENNKKKKGLKAEEAYEAIIASSQRTDGAVNEMLGVSAPPAGSASAHAAASAKP